MSKVVSSDGRYTYCRNSRSGDHQEIDIHEIISRRSNGKMIILCVSCLLLILCFYGSAVLPYVSRQPSFNLCIYILLHDFYALFSSFFQQESRHVSVVGVLVISISVLVSSQLRTVQKGRFNASVLVNHSSLVPLVIILLKDIPSGSSQISGDLRKKFINNCVSKKKNLKKC